MNLFGLLGVVAAVLGVSLLIIVHEAGHYLVARAFGMKVERFSVGFGKVVWSVTRRGTQFAVSALPLGGYVKIVGMAPGEDVDPADPTIYSNQGAWRRFLAILAGPAMNFVTAALLAAALLAGPGLLTPDPAAAVGRVTAGSPADRAGLRRDDRVLSVAGQPVATWGDMVGAIRAHPGSELDLVVERGAEGSRQQLALKLALGKDGIAGFRMHELPVTTAGLAALRDGFARTAESAWSQVAMFGKLFSGGKGTSFVGPLGIIGEMLERLREGLGPFVNVLWMLSVALAIFNLLPIPGLDGGRLVFLAYELVTRRRVDARVETYVHMAGLLAIIVLIAWVTVFGDLHVGQWLQQHLGK
jgi:regulator of sigma E protease